MKLPAISRAHFLECEQEIPKRSPAHAEPGFGAMQVDSRTESSSENWEEAHHVSMSESHRNGVTIVTEGPLEGKEAKIQSTDISSLQR